MDINIKDSNGSYNKNIYLIIGIIVFVLLIIGGTYAYMTLAVNVTNGSYVVDTTCFDIDYDVTNDDGTLPISGDMFPSGGPVGGLSGKVSLKINDNCSVEGVGTIMLNVVDVSNTFIQTVAEHCENSVTLSTMTDFTTSSDCTAQTNGIWVTNGSALKYAVYDTNSVTNNTVPLSVGYVNKTGSIDIYDNFSITESSVTYYVYIWLDGNLSDNSYAGLSFDGNVSVSALQTEE